MRKCAALFAILLWSIMTAKPALAAQPTDFVQTAALTWATERDGMSGERMLCRSEVTAEEGGDSFSCFLSDGLTFDRVTAVFRNGEPVNAAMYTVVTERQRNGAAFTLHVCAEAAGAPLVVEYILRVNDAAGAENWFSLVREGEEPKRGGCLRLFSLRIFRGVFVSESGQLHPVSGSCLCLTRDRSGHDRVAFRQRDEDTYLACTAVECGHARHLYVMKTPRNGIIRLEGVPQGTYYLRETRPSDGTVEAAEPREITITAEGEIFCDGTEQPDGMASMIHSDHSAAEKKRFSLLAFYRGGIRLLTVLLCILIGSRRYAA